ncbi:MAG: InlB B-repeat-containing protein, partial [Clostridiales bacterium]|nr:InlB B-repeat-containing protein [Clostridiales bacterium]
MAGGRKRLLKIFTVTLMSAVFVAGALSTGAVADETPEPQYATKTTLESGPYNKHTPVTYVYDLETDRNHGYTLPQGLYQDYLQSLGLLFPGDKVRILPELDESENDTNRNKNHRTPGKALVVDGAYLDLAAGESYGPIKVTESVTYGSGAGTHTYIRELEVIGDNPIMLQGYGSTSATWAYFERADPDKPGSNIVTDHWGVTSMQYIILPAYQPVEYRYMCNGVKIEKPSDAEFYDDEQNPEVIWAEDLSSKWSQAASAYTVSGTDFRISRPFIEGYYFDSFHLGNNTELISTTVTYAQTTEDGDHYVLKFFNTHHLEFNLRFDNAKHGKETDTMVIMLNYKNSSSCGTVTLDANGGKIGGRDSYIFNSYYSFDLEEHQPVREGYVLEGWYKDAELTQLIASVSDINCNYTVEGYIDKCMPAATIYAGWADETSQDINDGDLEITGLVEKTYDGTPQTQDPVIKYKGTELVKDRDYELLYGDNIKASTASPLYIRGKGLYRGIVKKTFIINQMLLTPVITMESDTMVYKGAD